MRQRPYAFLRVGNRWINMTMVTDIEDRGDELTLYMTSEMARLTGRDEPAPIDVARRVTLKTTEDVEKARRWLMLNDED
jgi:hypothetical protein